MPTVLRTGAVLSAVFLSACGSLPFNIDPDYRLDPKAGDGVAVFSVSEACPSTMTVKIKAIGRVFDEAIAIDQSKALRPAPLQWRNPCGRVVMRQLSAGTYEFSSFALIGAVPGSTFVEPAQPFAIPFNVTAGKATYLGHLNFDISFERAAYQLNVEDRRDRDIEVLKNHARNINEADILHQIATTGVPKGYQPLRGVKVQLQIVR